MIVNLIMFKTDHYSERILFMIFRKNYFVKIDEFVELNKNPFISAFLSLVLGIFGAHRFYLKRKLSGFLFLIISITSLEYGEGNMAGVLIIIFFVESIVYFTKGIILLINKHRNKNGDKTMNKSYGVKQEEKFEQITMGFNNDEDVHVIEVSNIEPVKIVNQDKFDKVDWISKLELPYNVDFRGLNQIEKEVFVFYIRLCDFIDEELRRKMCSLIKENKKVMHNKFYYSDNLFDTIYHIASSHVFRIYSSNYTYYNSEYYYRTLENYLNKNLRNKIHIKAKELETEISPPSEETYRYFDLTKYGTPIEWWDKDGELRCNVEFSELELNILKVTPPRNTKPWELYIVRKHIINLYLKVWKIIHGGLDKDYKWRKRIKSSLEDVSIGKVPHYADFVDNNILEGLVKLSENIIRELMPNMQILNMSNDEANMQKYLPKEIVADIYDILTKYKESISSEDLEDIVITMIDKNPNDWKLKAQLILMTESDKQNTELISYGEDSNFIKIAKELVKKTDNKELILSCLYGIGREEKLTKKNNKLLESIIHPSNISQYQTIIDSKEALSIELINRLVSLETPIRKKISLDMEKVEVSKQELNETVEIVKEYIGEETNIDKKVETIKEEAVIPASDIRTEFKHGEFLKLVLDHGFISIEEGKKIAMENGVLLNAFISDINRELYDYIKDQVIIIEEDIKIDDFYVDMVKELIVSEA